VTTIQRVAEVVHRDLNAGLPAAGILLTPVTVPVSQQTPDETIPALPSIP
jgi:hypothetical protein